MLVRAYLIPGILRVNLLLNSPKAAEYLCEGTMKYFFIQVDLKYLYVEVISKRTLNKHEMQI